MKTTRDVIKKDSIVVCFAGDSGDGMQLIGTIFSNVSALLGNDISTFPDYPSEIRAPQGTLGGVSGFQVHFGSDVHTSGDLCDVLVAMNPAALKKNKSRLSPRSVIVIDSDSFTERDLKKAEYATLDPFTELNLKNELIEMPLTSMCLESLKDLDLDKKTALKSKNMMALGLVCWLFERPLESVEALIRSKFSKKKAHLADINIKVLNDGYNFGHNIHASISQYQIESTVKKEKGRYIDLSGNQATSYGLVAAAEKSGLQLFLGSYPITPATDILHNLSKLKELGVVTVQCEDEIAGCASAVGASFAGNLAVTTTSGPGICLKSEAINLAVMMELPLVVVDVQRGGPSTGMPTKSEQGDLLQALYGRNGESPLVVMAPTSPTDCFDTAFWAAKIALEHMTPVVMLSDAYAANGASAWRIPDLSTYPTIKPNYVKPEMAEGWTPYLRDEKSLVRYWATPGMEGFTHRVGGLEKDYVTGSISSDPKNHQKMVNTRKAKIDKIAQSIPKLDVLGDKSADTLVVGWGSTYGHLLAALEKIERKKGKLAFAHFKFINPLPSNTEEVLRSYSKIIIAEQNTGQFALVIGGLFPHLNIYKYNRVEGQPLNVDDLVSYIEKVMEDKL